MTKPKSERAVTEGKAGRVAALAVAALGAAFVVVRNKSRQAERDHPPAGQFLMVDGVRLHYLDQGEGPVLVLLHGNITMAEDFKLSGLLDLLACDFRVIAFDRPGYGYSERPRDHANWTPQAQARLLDQALGQLGIDACLVLGHSWGAMVAAAMGMDFSQRIKGLLLLSGYYYPSLRPDVPAASMPAIPVLGDLMRYTTSPLAGRLLWPATIKAAFSPSKIPDSFQRFPVWMTLRPSQVRACAAEAGLMVPAAAQLQQRYAELTMPVTLMAGDGDLVTDPESNSTRLHHALAHSRLRLLPGMGHMLQHLAQDEIAAEARSLAASTSLGRGGAETLADRQVGRRKTAALERDGARPA
ncbi:MAG: alpha/beta hydrolase [Pseudomonadota bacterium]